MLSIIHRYGVFYRAWVAYQGPHLYRKLTLPPPLSAGFYILIRVSDINKDTFLAPLFILNHVNYVTYEGSLS